MEFDITLGWQIVKSIKSLFMSSIDNDCAKYGGISKRNSDRFPVLLSIWTETRIDGDTKFHQQALSSPSCSAFFIFS